MHKSHARIGVALAISFVAPVAAAAPTPERSAGCIAWCEKDAQDLCARCDEHNVCSDLYHVDRAAFDACHARVQACHDEAYDCTSGHAAFFYGRCGEGDRAACCAAACVRGLDPPRPTSPLWLYVEGIIAPLVRIDEDVGLDLAFGGQLELLFGSDERQPPSLGLRLGPFAGGLVYLGGGGQLSAGLTALVWGATGEVDQGFGSAVTISGGAVYDMPAGAENAFGGLARVSLGVTTVGRSIWKAVSAWFFVEGQWIPDDAGDRAEIIVGLRVEPLAFFFLLIPGAGDD